MVKYGEMIGPEPDSVDLGAAYGESRKRLSAVVAATESPSAVAVPACPGWSVHDVVSHLVAVIEDVFAGRLTGPPDEAVTAEQVSRRKGRPTDEVLAEWEALSPGMEELLAGVAIWPAALDVLSHEHDVRGALGDSGARDLPIIPAAAAQLLTWFEPPVALTVNMMDQTYEHRSNGGNVEPVLELQTSPYEWFRLRMGRRSRRQLAAMAWTSDPGRLLDSLTVFGPSTLDIIE